MRASFQALPVSKKHQNWLACLQWNRLRSQLVLGKVLRLSLQISFRSIMKRLIGRLRQCLCALDVAGNQAWHCHCTSLSAKMARRLQWGPASRILLTMATILGQGCLLQVWLGYLRSLKGQVTSAAKLCPSQNFWNLGPLQSKNMNLQTIAMRKNQQSLRRLLGEHVKHHLSWAGDSAMHS